MNYKGIPYQIVETASPKGFKWIVQFGNGRIIMGHTLTQDGAAFAAKYTIDRVAEKPKAK